MEAKLYYTPPKNEIFDELKESAIKVWSTYDDTYGYATKKINNIKNIENVGDNFMYMISMFDMENQIRLSTLLSEECSNEVRIRMVDGGTPSEYIVF